MNCILVILSCTILAIHGLSEDEDFIFEGFRGYPMFHEEEIRGKRTAGNVMRNMDTADTQGSDIGRGDTLKKSELPITEEQIDRVLREAFNSDPFSDDATASQRNTVGENEDLLAKYSLDGSIPLSIIENEKHSNPYQRDIVENELVESPFSDMDTGMSKGRKFRHKVV